MTITESQLYKLRHMLGVGSHIPKSQWGYRNQYCAEVGCADEAQFIEMEQAGLVKRGRTINDGRDVYYHATKAGCQAAGLADEQIKESL